MVIVKVNDGPWVFIDCPLYCVFEKFQNEKFKKGGEKEEVLCSFDSRTLKLGPKLHSPGEGPGRPRSPQTSTSLRPSGLSPAAQGTSPKTSPGSLEPVCPGLSYSQHSFFSLSLGLWPQLALQTPFLLGVQTLFCLSHSPVSHLLP